MNFSTVKDKVLDLVFPQARCLACDEPRKITTRQPLCDDCALALDGLRVGEQACGLCLSPMKAGQACQYCLEGGMMHLSHSYAPYVYREQARQLIMALKFGPVELAARPLAMEMALCISGVRFDALVPVPLHKFRLRERGMNQSMVLCKVIEEYTGLPVLDALTKVKDTHRQSDLPRDQRKDNVKDAFLVNMDVNELDILLVDDVRTTGNTARECARVLLEAGALSVSLLTGAVAGKGDRHD